ncbi:MAG: TRAP transporter small permease [Lachnospiraceae bacterium]|nr:TRAP transporter small permease [Lachnospiraceae bacterium]
MSVLKRISRSIDVFFDKMLIVPTLMMIALLLICAVTVAFRKILIGAFNWSDEAMRFLMVYATFLALPSLVSKKKSIAIDLTDALFGSHPMGKKIFYLICEILIFIGCAVLLPTCVTFMKANRTGFSPAMKLPLFWVYSCMPIGFALSAVASLNNIFKLLVKED